MWCGAQACLLVYYVSLALSNAAALGQMEGGGVIATLVALATSDAECDQVANSLAALGVLARNAANANVLAAPDTLPNLLLHLTATIQAPNPYTLHPAPYTLHPTPYTPHPKPYTPQPTPYTIHPTPHTLNP